MVRYERRRKDGTREVVIDTGSHAPIWLEGEPAWHFWLLALTWFVALPIGVIAIVVWSVLH